MEVIKELWSAIKSGVRSKLDSEDKDIDETSAKMVFDFIDALEQGRFHFEYETWHSLRDSGKHLPAEMLIRARNIDEVKIPPLEPITLINDWGFHTSFDKAIILLSVKQALRHRHKNISINTSARNISDEKFWLGIKNSLRSQYGDLENIKLTFEITEDALASKPCRDILLAMKKELGCRFAIDDTHHDYKTSRLDLQRLLNLAARKGYKEYGIDGHEIEISPELPIIDFVKLDGIIIRDALDQSDPLKEKIDIHAVIKEIRALFPNALIIAEKVRTPKEAKFLMDHTDIDAVQGLFLPHDRAQMHIQIKQFMRAAP